MPQDVSAPPPSPSPAAEHEVRGACALDCPDGCSWIVTVREGRAVRLRGDETHPFTQGGLCAKVNPYLDYAADERRVLYPLRRTAPKGVGGPDAFERISWDEALALLAGRITSAVAEHGPASVWPFAGTGSVGWLQGCGGSSVRLFNALGASRHDLDICSRSGTLGMRYSAGSPMGLDPADLQHSAAVVLWGTNTLTTNLHLWPFITRARRAGAPLVVVDPVRTRTAAQADLHVAPRPGTDGALVLGVAAELVARGVHDEEYLNRWTLGWRIFRDTVLAEWSLERAAEVCDVPVETVRALADVFATHRPTGVRTLMGVQRHAGGGQAVRLLSVLPALTGDYGRLGGGLCYSTGAAYPLSDAALTRPDLRPDPHVRSLSMSRLGDELLQRTDPPVDVLMIWAANPVVSNPDQTRTRAGLAREGLFTAVVEHVLTPTTDYADLVLPGTTQVEHVDLVESYSHVHLAYNAPAVEPPGECRSHTQIFRDLATALGRHEPELHASDDDLVRAALSSPHPALRDVTLERLQAEGWVRMTWPDPYVPFAEGFPTPSGLFEFASETAERDGLGLLPGYEPPAEAGAPGDGLALVSAANHYQVNSTFAGSSRHRRAGASIVRVHPEDAAAHGVADGDQVEVVNARGAFTAQLQTDPGLRRGVAATSKGLSPAGPLGTSVNATVSGGRSDMGGGALFHDNVVHVRPAGGAAVEPAGPAAPDTLDDAVADDSAGDDSVVDDSVVDDSVGGDAVVDDAVVDDSVGGEPVGGEPEPGTP